MARKLQKKPPVPCGGHKLYNTNRSFDLFVGTCIRIKNYLKLPNLIGQNFYSSRKASRYGL